MKVLHVHDIAFVATNFVAGLRNIGVDASLYELRKVPKTGILKWLKNPINVIFKIYEIFRFKQFLNKNQFDIIHIHFGSFAYLALLNKVPYYLHIHGTDIREYIRRPLLGYLIQQGIHRAEKVFYTTPDLEVLIMPYRKDAIFFPNPIDTELFNPNSKLKFEDHHDVFVISKIDKYKGIKEILNSIDLLWDVYPNIKVRTFGFGNAMEEAREFFNKHSGRPELKITGPVSHENMIRLINSSKLILGQLGTGILTCSELEAMACGKPVICNFSYPGIYQTDPPIVYARNSEEAKEKILLLITDPSLADVTGSLGRAWIEDYHNKETISKMLVTYYQM
jgi:glycosyltransferase involved in cell wall biosynthesis